MLYFTKRLSSTLKVTAFGTLQILNSFSIVMEYANNGDLYQKI
jgi:hypothetical protein